MSSDDPKSYAVAESSLPSALLASTASQIGNSITANEESADGSPKQASLAATGIQPMSTSEIADSQGIASQDTAISQPASLSAPVDEEFVVPKFKSACSDNTLPESGPAAAPTPANDELKMPSSDAPMPPPSTPAVTTNSQPSQPSQSQSSQPSQSDVPAAATTAPAIANTHKPEPSQPAEMPTTQEQLESEGAMPTPSQPPKSLSPAQSPQPVLEDLEAICKRHRQYHGSLPFAIESSDKPQDGLKVWGKMDGYRPWPGYILLKRNTKKEGIYTQFYGPDDEYTWLTLDQLVPLLPHHLPELARDCDDSEELLAALVEAFTDYINCCPYCWQAFHTRFALDTHASTYHPDCDPLTDDDITVAQLRFQHHAKHAVEQAYQGHYSADWAEELTMASIENSTKTALAKVLSNFQQEHRFDKIQLVALFEAEIAHLKDTRNDDTTEAAEDVSRSLRSNTSYVAATPAAPTIKTSHTGHRYMMSAPRRKTATNSSEEGHGEDSVYSQAEIRIGEEYQVPRQSIPEANTRAARETRPDTTNLMWCPDEELEELEGYTAYFKFANTQGLRHHSDTHFNTGDIEYAYHILYSAHCNPSRTAKRFVVTEGLKMLTSKSQVKLNGPYRQYHYTGSNPWNKQERDMFLKGYKTYGKQFHLIADMLPHKAHRDVVEYYYAYFKRSPGFSAVKQELRDRARAEAIRAQTEGAVTACDHCSRSKTPRWREGPNNEDWCDQCYWFHYSNGQLPQVTDEYRAASPLDLIPWVKRPAGRKAPSRGKRQYEPLAPSPSQTKPKRAKPRSRSRATVSPKPVADSGTTHVTGANIRKPSAQPPASVAQLAVTAQPTADQVAEDEQNRKAEQDKQKERLLALQAQLQQFGQLQQQRQQEAVEDKLETKLETETKMETEAEAKPSNEVASTTTTKPAAAAASKAIEPTTQTPELPQSNSTPAVVASVHGADGMPANHGGAMHNEHTSRDGLVGEDNPIDAITANHTPGDAMDTSQEPTTTAQAELAPSMKMETGTEG
eukprot:m.165741 g.165741  ORF g.165741 m.165741 type:complete len:1016 (+) comp16603_c0_seq2:40-3087(+)